MPTTTNFGWTTPADTDLVKDGAAAIRTLGNGIDTSLLDLKGGTTGQVLSKNSNTDLDYTWVTPNVGDITEVQAGTGISVASGTGPIPVVTNTVATTYDAKGDLVVGTGADTFAKLTVGTDGHTLVADSGQTTGLKWAAPSAPAFVGCSVSKTAVQSIPNSTYTAITFDSENWDTDSIHSNVTNNTRLTVPSGKGGKWLLSGNMGFASNATGSRFIRLYKNGSSVGFPAAVMPINGDDTIVSISFIVDVAASDYIEVYVFQSSGGSLNTLSTVVNTQFTYLGA